MFSRGKVKRREKDRVDTAFVSFSNESATVRDSVWTVEDWELPLRRSSNVTSGITFQDGVFLRRFLLTGK